MNINISTYQEKDSYLSTLRLRESFYFRNYKATERFEQRGEKDLEIDFTVFVKLFETADKEFIAEVKTTGFKKNGQSPDDKMSMLSIACMESISPISLMLSAEGQIKGFYDYKFMTKRFEYKRADLEDFFIGDIAQDYFNKFHTDLKNENYLLKRFCSALLYQSLLPQTDWFGRNKEWEARFYVMPNSFPVKCRLDTGYNFEDPDDVVIVIKGKIDEDCSLQELLKGVRTEELPEQNATGEIELRYIITKATKRLKKVEANIILLHEELLYHRHSLVLTAIEEEMPIKRFSTLIE